MSAESTQHTGGHAQDSGSYVLHHLTNLKLDLTTMTINPEATGFWVLHLDSVIFSVLLGIIFVFLFGRVARQASSGVPSGAQNFVEIVLDFVQGMVKEIFPKANALVAPLALTIFVWVFLMNLMDLIPVDWLPEAGKLAGVPYLKVVPSADVNITFGLSLSVFGLIIAYNLMFKGPVGFLREVLVHPFFVSSGPMIVLNVFLIPINVTLRIVEEVARPMSLALRLFGNLFAGELIFILIALMLAQAFNGFSGAVLAAGGVVLHLAWALFHILVITLQAFVFMVLTIVYLGASAEQHGEH